MSKKGMHWNIPRLAKKVWGRQLIFCGKDSMGFILPSGIWLSWDL